MLESSALRRTEGLLVCWVAALSRRVADAGCRHLAGKVGNCALINLVAGGWPQRKMTSINGSVTVIV